jgi:uncharacterized protein
MPQNKMPELDDSPALSTLCQAVTRDGKTVQVDIYADGDGGWLLEVVDHHGNSTVWDDSFSSEQEALDTVLEAIDEEGINALIGAPPDRPTTVLDQPLSDSDLNELDEFLASATNQDRAMNLSTLEGFLTAIAIGPNFVATSDWLPWVRDQQAGKSEANFASPAQFTQITSLILRHYNGILHAFNTDPTSFEPLFGRGDRWRAADWCEGFLNGFMFDEDAWGLLSIGQPTWFTPFLRLGTDEGAALNMPEESETLMKEVAPALANIRAYWQSRRGHPSTRIFDTDFDDEDPMSNTPVIRAGPKIGRNDPCPCESGKKFKKCCAANAATPSLH